MKDAHLSLELMAKWLAGDLEHDDLQTKVIPHLLASCPGCRERHEEIQRLKHEVGHWDERVAVFEGREAPELVAELLRHPFDEQLGMVADDPDLQSWAVCQLLLRKSREAAFEEPAVAVNLAELAVVVAHHLGKVYDPHWVLDLQARAYAYLGNARRVLGEVRSAETAFRRAESFLAESMTGNDEVKAEILDLKSSLFRDQRRLDEALDLIDQSLALWTEAESTHEIGLVQLKKAKILEENGQLDEAIELLKESIERMDPARDPRVLVYARHNLVWTLATAGRPAEAKQRLPEVQEFFRTMAKPVDFIRLHWTEAKIAHGLGQLAAAEETFRQVQQEFLQRGMGYDAALVSLDLAILYAQEHRTGDLKRLAAEMMPIFESRDVHREALAALVMFQKACEEERLAVELASEIAGTLQRERRARA